MSAARSFLNQEQMARHRALAIMGIDIYVLRGTGQNQSVDASVNPASKIRLFVQTMGAAADSSQNAAWMGLLRHLRLTLGLEEDEMCVNSKNPSGLQLCFGICSELSEGVVLLPSLNELSEKPQLKRQVWSALKKIIRSDLL